MIKHSNNITNYIEARSLRGLRLLMSRTQSRLRQKLRFRDIQSYSTKRGLRWVAFYDSEFSTDTVLEIEQDAIEGVK